MGLVRSVLAFLLGMAAGGSLLLACQVSQRTGKPLAAAFVEVPGEAKRLCGELRARATYAGSTRDESSCETQG